MSLRVEGAGQLAALSRDLKAAGSKELRREMLRELRLATRPAAEAVRLSAAAVLPHRGGLAQSVASSKITTRTTTGIRSAGVRIVATGHKPTIDVRSLDRGRLRHPVFGNRERWVDQRVPEDWFSRPLDQLSPTVQAAMKRVLDDIARRLAH